MLEQVHELKIIITGSNAIYCHPNLQSLLSGRNVTFTLYPFDFKEFLSISCSHNRSATGCFFGHGTRSSGLWFERYLEFGGFPAVQKAEIGLPYCSNISTTFFIAIIVMRFQVRVPRNLERFATYCFSHICQRFTFSRLASVCPMSKETLEEHFEYLTKAHALFGVEFFDFKQAQR